MKIFIQENWRVGILYNFWNFFSFKIKKFTTWPLVWEGGLEGGVGGVDETTIR